MRPYTIVFTTATVDGRIASSTGYSLLSCTYDKKRLYLLRGMTDAVMVGASTVEIDNPRLARRLEPTRPRFHRVVVDGRLRLTPGYRVFTDKTWPTIIVTCKGANPEKKKLFERAGVDLVEVQCRDWIADMREALARLHKDYGIEVLLVEGGGVLVYTLLAQNVVDELRVTYTPYIFASGRSLASDPEARGFTTREESPKMRLAAHELCPCRQCIHVVYELESWSKPPSPGIPYKLSDRLTLV